LELICRYSAPDHVSVLPRPSSQIIDRNQGVARMRKDQSLAAPVTRLVKRLAAGTGAALLATALIADAAVAEPDMSKDVQFAEKLNQLGGKTLQEIAGNRRDATVLISPYGLGSALHLLMLGAKEGSDAETSLKTSLVPGKLDNLDKAREGWQATSTAILGANKSDKVTLQLASAVYVPTTATVSENFGRKAPGVLGATLKSLDFKSPKALETINAWVNDKTKGQIPTILEKLEPDARFVILNAVHFKGAWELAFDPARTAKAPFTRVDGSKREDVPMMSATFPAQLAELGELQAVWLPYAGKDVAMLVIAPRSEGAPTLVADTLKSTSIDKLVAAAGKEAQERSVHVRLPRFRAESYLDLTNALVGQIGRALDADSDYSPINAAKKGPLLVVHRVLVDVTEAGTVAAAATAITSDRSLAVTPVLSADRPFAFAIVHRPTQAVLFAGYIADPGRESSGEK
jgi:serpin B